MAKQTKKPFSSDGWPHKLLDWTFAYLKEVDDGVLVKDLVKAVQDHFKIPPAMAAAKVSPCKNIICLEDRLRWMLTVLTEFGYATHVGRCMWQITDAGRSISGVWAPEVFAVERQLLCN